MRQISLFGKLEEAENRDAVTLGDLSNKREIANARPGGGRLWHAVCDEQNVKRLLHQAIEQGGQPAACRLRELVALPRATGSAPPKFAGSVERDRTFVMYRTRRLMRSEGDHLMADRSAATHRILAHQGPCSRWLRRDCYI
jgi:hypothetical protein